MNRRIPLTNAKMPARVVHSLRPEFSQLPFASFPRRLQALRASCKDRLDRGINDAAAYEHDLQFDQRPTFATHGLPRWEGSDAQRLLKIDITDSLPPDEARAIACKPTRIPSLHPYNLSRAYSSRSETSQVYFNFLWSIITLKDYASRAYSSRR
jgi:hypothetical protein